MGGLRRIIDDPVEILDLEDGVRQDLGRTVVDLLGKVLSLALLGLDDAQRQRGLRKIDIGAEICGHVFANGAIYVLRGTEHVPRPQYAEGPPIAERFRSGAKQGEEQWWISRLNLRDKSPQISDIAKVPFAARSLTFDGENFWSNHRAANETICFSLPN